MSDAAQWWTDPTDDQLQAVQFGLRVAAQHPWVTAEQAEYFTQLADAIWDEHFSRHIGEGPGPVYA